MLKNKTILGVFWNFGEQLLRRGTSIIVTLLLAYFLTPNDYGLIAILSLFLALGSALVESGLKQALIRKKNATQIDFSTAFYANIGLSLVAILAFIIMAPHVAEYYKTPQLENLIYTSSILLLLNSFQLVPLASMTKNMQFRGILKANFPAALISGSVAVLLAYNNFGVWALIWQMVTFSLCLNVLLWFFCNWQPGLLFSFTSLREMYIYGLNLFISSILDVVYKNIFVIIIAKVLSIGTAGLYFFADRIKELIIAQLIASIQVVTFPALARIQDDAVRLKQAYRNIMLLMTFLVFPVLLLFVVVCELLFQIFLPNEWLKAVPYLQLMCLTSLVIPLISVNLNIIKVKGRSDWYLYLEILKKISAGIALLLTYKDGVIAILVGQLISQFINYFPSVYVVDRLVDYSIYEQVADFFPNLAVSVFLSSFTYYGLNLLPFSAFCNLSIVCISFIGGFILVSFAFNLKSLKLCVESLKSVF